MIGIGDPGRPVLPAVETVAMARRELRRLVGDDVWSVAAELMRVHAVVGLAAAWAGDASWPPIGVVVEARCAAAVRRGGR